jgi:hypothetical protein
MKHQPLPFLLFFASLFCITTAFAQDPDSAEIAKRGTLTISGSGDVYYRYDMVGHTRANNYTSFTNSHNSFELGMLSAKIEYNYKGVGGCLDLGFGKRALEFSYNEARDMPMLTAIKQLYIYYQPKDWIKLTVGSWGTHVGYEVLDPYLNKNYSMSYLFTNGPFFHTGVKAEFFVGKHSFMVGVANPTDYKYYPLAGFNSKTAIAQYSVVVNPHLSLYLNYVGGKGTDTLLTNQIDFVLSSNITEKVSLGFNATFAVIDDRPLKRSTVTTNYWYGEAVYFTYAPKEWASINLRAEHFGDPSQLKVLAPFAAGGHVFETTLSANFKTHGLTFIPEFRFDGSTQEIFSRKDGAGSHYSGSFLIAAIYNFSVQPKLR